jgi:hypothetical protein
MLLIKVDFKLFDIKFLMYKCINVRENRRGNRERIIQRKQKGQSRTDNPETLTTLGTQDTGRRMIFFLQIILYHVPCVISTLSIS